MTAKDKIKDILELTGKIDNFYCIDNRITTRLSDVVFRLQKEGWIFDDEKSGFVGDSKNWCYVLKSKPLSPTLRPEIIQEKLQSKLL